MFPSPPNHQDRNRFQSEIGRLLTLFVLALSVSGCSSITLMVSRAVFGDAHTDAAFHTATGKDLTRGHNAVVIFCSAPTAITESSANLPADLQGELYMRMKKNGIKVVDPNKVISVLDRASGRFDAQKLADEFPEATDFFHVVIEKYTDREPSSGHMYRGRARGIVYCYEAKSDPDDPKAKRHVVRSFEKEFQSEYPKTYPLSAEQISKKVFQRQFIDNVADRIGEIFYDVPLSEAN